MNKTLKLVLKVAISLALLAFLFTQSGIEDTFARLSEANLWYIPVSIVIYLLSQWVSSYRWQFLCRPLGFRLSLRDFYDFYLIGMFLNLFLPGSIGGDVGRMYYLAKRCNRKKREALLTLLAERGVGLAALLLMTGLLALTPTAAPLPNGVRWMVILLSAAMVTGFLVIRGVPLRRWAEKIPKLELLAQAEVYWRDVPLLAKSVSISLLVHGFMVLIHLLIAQALGLSIPPLYLAMVYGIVSLVSVIPIAFNGIGVREGTYQLLLIQVGISPDVALAFGLYWFLISTLTSLAGGLVMLKGHYKAPSAEEVELA